MHDWSALSHQQMTAIMHLSFAMPAHEGYLRNRIKVRGPTLRSLVRAGYARQFWLVEEGGSQIGIPFYCLTQKGQRLRRDYIRWHKRLKAMTGRLPPSMQKVLDLA